MRYENRAAREAVYAPNEGYRHGSGGMRVTDGSWRIFCVVGHWGENSRQIFCISARSPSASSKYIRRRYSRVTTRR